MKYYLIKAESIIFFSFRRMNNFEDNDGRNDECLKTPFCAHLTFSSVLHRRRRPLPAAFLRSLSRRSPNMHAWILVTGLSRFVKFCSTPGGNLIDVCIYVLIVHIDRSSFLEQSRLVQWSGSSGKDNRGSGQVWEDVEFTSGWCHWLFIGLGNSDGRTCGAGGRCPEHLLS